jgi:hypothetical protein
MSLKEKERKRIKKKNVACSPLFEEERADFKGLRKF